MIHRLLIIRTILSSIPPHFFKPADAQAFVVDLNLNGEVKYNLQTDTDIYSSVTSVNQYGDILYIDNLHSESYATYDLNNDAE